MSASNLTNEKIQNVFNKLSYEPVLDSLSAVESWVALHNNKVISPFINGVYSTPTTDQSKQLYASTNPFTGSFLANLIDCDETVVKSALASAQNAYSTWHKLTYLQRGRIIYNIARNIQKNTSLLIACESVTSGRTSREVKDLDVAAIIKTFYHYAGIVGKFQEIDPAKYSSLGVVAICGYFDSPLLSICDKLAASLATGNTCVLIPHKKTPLSAYLLAEICKQSGVPEGVVNVVSSSSDDIYKFVATGADCVTFDGKTSSGHEILISDSFVKPSTRTLLSLEGKAALCIYEDSDVDSAVEAVVDGCFYANGMHRYSLNKVLIQECLYADVVHRLKTRFSKVKTGNHLDKCNDYGPVSNSEEFESRIAREVATNGAVVTQNKEGNVGSKLISPTIIENAALNSQFNLEELNGPYIQLLQFRTVKESVDLLNNSKYGSCVSIFSQNVNLVMEVAYLLDAGTVWMNSFPVERGVQVRKASGNYAFSGSKSLHNFLKPNYENYAPRVLVGVDDSKRKLKAYGALSSDKTPDFLSVQKTYKMYVGGKQARADTSSSRPVYLPDVSDVYALVSDASRKDVRNAVEAANNSFKGWWKRSNHNKAQILFFFEENLRTRRDEFVFNLEILTKKTRTQCEIEFQHCLDIIFYLASFCDKNIGYLNDSTEYGYQMEIKEAIGCIAIVCGHNEVDPNPLLSFVLHLFGAIAYGNTVVIVPDEKCPTLALDLIEVFETSDMPGGVVNILSGSKHHLTKYLCEHQQVRSIWYMNDHTQVEIDNKLISDEDLNAQQFVKYTSNLSFKQSWLISTPLLIDEHGFDKVYLSQIEQNSTQIKYVHIPMGIIFAN